jgi:A/G-specific adenine glycosylase
MPVRSTRMLIIENQRGEILLHKRPPTGIWSGLWIFPEVAHTLEPVDFCRDTLDAELLANNPWPSYRHTFSHYHLDIEPLHLRVTVQDQHTMEAGQALWYNRAQPQAVGLAAPMKKLMALLPTQIPSEENP